MSNLQKFEDVKLSHYATSVIVGGRTKTIVMSGSGPDNPGDRVAKIVDDNDGNIIKIK